MTLVPRLVRVALLLFLGLGACARTASSAPAQAASRPAAPSEGRTDASVTLFVADRVCRSLEPVAVHLADASPANAVRAIVRSKALSQLSLSDPAVKVTQNTALVDLRVRQGTERSLRDLSGCEQLALLTAIRQTLRANTQWGIRQVVFTDRGSLLAI